MGVDHPEIRVIGAGAIDGRGIAREPGELGLISSLRCPGQFVYRLELSLERFDGCSYQTEAIAKGPLEKQARVKTFISDLYRYPDSGIGQVGFSDRRDIAL